MIKINFVCYGNICRSPIAEFVMKNLVDKAGIAENFLIESSGCYPAVGTPIHVESCRELSRNKIPFNHRTSKEFTKDVYEKFDYVICMDKSNVRAAKYIADGDPDKKIFLLMDFAGEHRDVDDPYYTDKYDVAFRDILRGCQALLKTLIKDG